eukprot:scaffold14594_cov127-Isochrysis_galbana.AAC.1
MVASTRSRCPRAHSTGACSGTPTLARVTAQPARRSTLTMAVASSSSEPWAMGMSAVGTAPAQPETTGARRTVRPTGWPVCRPEATATASPISAAAMARPSVRFFLSLPSALRDDRSVQI